MTKARIEIGLTGDQGKIELNGIDVSTAVAGFVLQGHVRDMTTLSLTLIPRRTEVDAEAKVVLTPEVEAIMEAAGWVPPGRCTGGCR